MSVWMERAQKSYKIGATSVWALTVDPKKHFKATLMRPGRHYIRVIFTMLGTETTEVVELDALL